MRELWGQRVSSPSHRLALAWRAAACAPCEAETMRQGARHWRLLLAFLEACLPPPSDEQFGELGPTRSLEGGLGVGVQVVVLHAVKQRQEAWCVARQVGGRNDDGWKWK